MENSGIDYTPAPWWHGPVNAIVEAHRNHIDYMGRPLATTVRVLRGRYIEVNVGVRAFTVTLDYPIDDVATMRSSTDDCDFYTSPWHAGRIRIYRGINPMWRPRPLRHETPESIAWT